MSAQSASIASEPVQDGWSMDKRGYIQGGYDTPIFLKAKRIFNSRKTFLKTIDKNIKQSQKAMNV